MTIPKTFYLDVSVVVNGGTGSQVFWDVPDAPPAGFVSGFSAALLNVAAKVPTGTNPTFDWMILDADGFAVAGRAGLQGSTTTVETVPIYPRATMNVSNATSDGTYLFRVYAKQSQ